MKKLIRFLLFAVIMMIATSCMTTSYVQSSDDSIYDTESSFRLFNPLGYELCYSPIYGYHYYDSYRTRFLFDDFIYMYNPNFGMYRQGRYHWDYFSYQQNHRFDRIDRNRNFVQRHEGPNYSMKRGSNSNYQRSESQVQRNNSTRGSYQNSHQQKSSTIQRGSTSPTRGSYQQNSSTRQNVQRSAPARGTYQRSPAVQQKTIQRNTAPNRSNSTGRRR